MSSTQQAIRARIADLYEDHHGWLQRWLGRKLGCEHTASDLSHDAFVKLFTGEDPARLREPRAYLLVIANRLMINFNRRRKVEEEALRQVAVLISNCDTRSPDRIETARNLLADVVLLLLEELPANTRQALIMAKVDGLTYRQIADRLNVSESSVKQYLAKALVHCHARLFPDDD